MYLGFVCVIGVAILSEQSLYIIMTIYSPAPVISTITLKIYCYSFYKRIIKLHSFLIMQIVFLHFVFLLKILWKKKTGILFVVDRIILYEIMLDECCMVYFQTCECFCCHVNMVVNHVLFE